MNVPIFANRISALRPSPIREILKVIDRPGMISFAGGLPATDTFPKLEMDIPIKYLQYGPSEGEPELREAVAQLVSSRGLPCQPEQVLILSGSQQGIDLVGKLFIDRGSEIAMEFPTYLAALQVFDLYSPCYIETTNLNSRTRLAYVIPTFQNPTGHCYNLEERQKLAKQCDKTSTVLYEDDPYSDLVFDDVCRVPICSMMEKSSWIYQGSFSKSLCPGLRLGYLVCSEDLIPFVTPLKQAADLHSNRLSQYLVLNLLTDSSYSDRLQTLRHKYREKRDTFDSCLKTYFDHLACWEKPRGGLFFWVTLNPDMNVNLDTLFHQCIENNVAFMPGNYFYPERYARSDSMRFNFSHANAVEADRGLRTLSRFLEASRN